MNATKNLCGVISGHICKAVQTGFIHLTKAILGCNTFFIKITDHDLCPEHTEYISRESASTS